MAPILILSGGSPTAAAYAGYAAARLGERGRDARVVCVRDLPTLALLTGDADHPAIARLRGDGVEALVVVAAVTRASTSGLLKTLVGLLAPEVPALPVAVGAFPAHARVLDHALRPALGPRALPTLFLPEHQADLDPLDAALGTLETVNACSRPG
ncbi:NAD(P)H-dependent oxidoreductase [Actinokineospora sp. UTMC 2448]|uniref:NAD(P)H-dependent oxidoreductase n=1 Tax=Actinokineospora sp. UTMC 2448 TaxID=2268449 RepID=UPI002164E4BC|nr:NAD(P)H-dependent oxidoreductase [Actinokineospora sp. UTMC 2448]UVS80092.1 NAD(P)H-dependent FMN reductase [Actinokineospora sp. UTMC 2448]